MLLFIKAATGLTDEYILKYTSEALEKFKEWIALRGKESGKQVKRFCTDGGGEYTANKFAEYLNSESIIQEMTTSDSPQSGGVVERANFTIMELLRCMLDESRISKMFRNFAVPVADYLKNCTPMRLVVGKTPYDASHGRKLSVKHLPVFGCLALVHIPKEKPKKLEYRATPSIFIG
jgi:hypothetical protein